MALRIRKVIKKSSYYVWFLGAKESKGLRGESYILPVISHLVEREKEIEPFKVTLQISQKGLKIIQNVLSTNPKTSKPKNETIKHFIPHNTITCVYQNEDIVSCILLLYNPITKCPLHVHVYRCDSVETASLLKSQLEVLIERPDNQKKYLELESRWENQKRINSSVSSDAYTSTRESESSEELFTTDNKMTSLYDSLAAELRQKLGKNESPILLPPRDYDTVHRQKGNLHGIDMRRCLNASIVGQNAKKKIESSGGSSGIGSDHAPSPDSPDSPERFNLLDNQSTSDEEWNIDQTDSTLYLMHGSDMILPRPSRHPDASKFSPEPPKSPTYHQEHRFSRYPENIPKYYEKSSKEQSKYDNSDAYLQRHSAENQKYSSSSKENLVKESSKRYEKYDNSDLYHQRQFEDSHKYSSKYEERYLGNSNKYSSKYQEDFEEEPKYRDKRYKERFFEDEEDRNYTLKQPSRYQDQEKIRPNYYNDTKQYYMDSKSFERSKPLCHEDRYSSSRNKMPEEYFEDIRRRPEDRQRTPTPETNVSPKDRFKNAKETFLLLEKRRIEDPGRFRRQELHSSVPNLKDKTFLKRHESMVYQKDDKRYDLDERYRPQAAPRKIMEDDVRYRREKDIPLERYRSEQRRSLYNKMEDDHKIKSNEIARELKKRSYGDIPEDIRYPGPEKDNFQYSKSNLDLDTVPNDLKVSKNHKMKVAPGYRHSYAEPKISLEKMKKSHFPEIVHRTNSSVSNSGRVGLASVNPY